MNAISAWNQAKNKNTPKAVNTPLPPRKPAMHVKEWPKIAIIPAAMGSHSAEAVP